MEVGAAALGFFREGLPADCSRAVVAHRAVAPGERWVASSARAAEEPEWHQQEHSAVLVLALEHLASVLAAMLRVGPSSGAQVLLAAAVAAAATRKVWP